MVLHLEMQLLQSMYFLLCSLLYSTLFGSLSQNKPGRQDVPFAVLLGHIYVFIHLSIFLVQIFILFIHLFITVY